MRSKLNGQFEYWSSWLHRISKDIMKIYKLKNTSVFWSDNYLYPISDGNPFVVTNSCSRIQIFFTQPPDNWYILMSRDRVNLLSQWLNTQHFNLRIDQKYVSFFLRFRRIKYYSSRHFKNAIKIKIINRNNKW